MIQKVRMKNFRRYVDETIEFNHGLTFIEGPNNAGKTTVFLAIEYGLFGTVAGFSSQAQLSHPESTNMGVELTYLGRDGNQYILQRMHEVSTLSVKSKGGHFTMKIVDDLGERYLISSDFPKDTENDLQLKIFETTGLSRRLFDIAVNIKQGEIANLLEGTSKLDIVLGVSAAVMAQKQLAANALSFEKESTQIDTLQASSRAISSELNELEKQAKSLKTEVEKEEKGLQTKLEEEKRIKKEEQDFLPIKEKYIKYHETTVQWDREYNKIEQQAESIESITNEHGTSDVLKKKIDDTKEITEKSQKNIDQLEKEKNKQQKVIRKLEQDLGDLKGKIQRRESIGADEQVCEVCGAPIDATRVAQELETWITEKGKLDSLIKQKEDEITEKDDQINKLRQELNERKSELTKFTTVHKQLEQFSLQLKESLKSLENLGNLMQDAAVELYDKIQEYNQQTEEKMRFKRPEILVRKWLNEVEEETLQVRFMDDIYSEKINREAERIQDKLKQLRVDKQVIEQLLKDKNSQLKNLKPRTERLNIDLAEITSSIKELERKRNAAEKMRVSGKIFKNVQKKLRDHAASSIARKTLEFHKQLSITAEFDELRVDPKKYSIYVNPKDVGIEVPAYSYQGSGQKLLLGLAYRLAIIFTVSKPPFILLDEPTDSLDTQHEDQLFEKISEIVDCQLMVITHRRGEREVRGGILQINPDTNKSAVEVVQ